MEPPVVSAADTALVDIAILLRNIPMERTKAIDIETHIANLNLFFVHQSYPSAGSPEVRHYYFEEASDGAGLSSQLKLTNIRVGKYRMYAVANYYNGSMDPGNMPPSHNNDPGYGAVDLSSVTEADLQSYLLYNKAGHLLMTAEDEVLIHKPGVPGQVATQDHIDINLVRQHAKVNFTATINSGNPALSGMTITGLYFGNWAQRVKSFATTEVGSSENFVTRSASFGTVSPVGGKAITLADCYPLANNQGMVPGLQEADRSAENAPDAASHLRVATLTGTSRYDYSVYLGANQTNDFNLEPNKNYTVNMNINGLEGDARISSMAITQPQFSAPGTGELVTSAEFEVAISNRFNERFSLRPQIISPDNITGTFEIFLYDEGLGDYSATPLPEESGNVLILDTNLPGSEAQMTVRYKIVFTANSIPNGYQEAVLSIALLTNSGQILLEGRTVIFNEN